MHRLLSSGRRDFRDEISYETFAHKYRLAVGLCMCVHSDSVIQWG